MDEKKVTLFIGGKPIGPPVKANRLLMGSDGKYTDESKWELPKEMNFSCELERNEEIDKIYQSIIDDAEQQVLEFYKEVNKRCEYILRNYITPPLKGEVTKGKLRCRGIKGLVWADKGETFLGIQQRNELILCNGKRVPVDDEGNIDWSVLHKATI